MKTPKAVVVICCSVLALADFRTLWASESAAGPISWRAVGSNLEITIPSGAIGAEGARLVLAWGEVDGGDVPSGWGQTADIGAVAASGGVWLFDPLEYGVPATCRLRVFAVSGYGLVDSIVSSGTHYLDTGIAHTQADTVDIDLRMDKFDGSKNSEIYGARNDSSGNVSVEAFSGFDSSRNTLTIADFCNTSASRLKVSHGKTFDAIVGKRLKMHLAAAGSRIRSDDGSINATSGAYGGTFTLGRTAWVFGINGAGWSRHPGMTLYSLDIDRGGDPLRRYRPVRFQSGALGLKDLLTGEELTNRGSGDFTAGVETNAVDDLTSCIACSDPGMWQADQGRIVAELTEYSGIYDAEDHALVLSVLSPIDGDGCTVRWAWNGAPTEADFTHDAPGVYRAPGVYTNIVRITDDADVMAPYVATGVVTIAAASDWTYSSKTITDGEWTLKVTEDGANLTVTGVNGAPPATTLLDLRKPVDGGAKTIVAVGEKSFDGVEGIKRLCLPETLTEISSAAFRNCTSLMHVTPFLPNALTVLGPSAFRYAPVEEDLTIANVNFKTIPNGLTGDSYAFQGIKSKVVDLSRSGIETIGSCVFDGNADLERVLLPETLAEIGSSTFRNCTSLRHVTPFLPAALTVLGPSAFRYAPVEEDLTIANVNFKAIPNGLSGDSYAFQGIKSKVVDLSRSGIESIGARAFEGCSEMTRLLLPATLTSLAGGSFGSCSGLRDVYWRRVTALSLADNAFAAIPELTFRHYIPRNDAFWAEFLSAKCTLVTPLAEDEAAGYELEFPGERMAKGKVKLPKALPYQYYLTWNPDRNGTMVLLR